MSESRQRFRAVRSETVPAAPIVATDSVALGPTVAPTAPHFPGVDEEPTPVFDGLWGSEPFAHLGAEIDAMDAMLAEQFPSWGLDEIAPLPIESLIKEMVAKVGEDVAWAVKQVAMAEIMSRRLAGPLGEEESDGDTTEPAGSGPAGDADVADPAEGRAPVDEDDRQDPGAAQAG